MKRGFGSDNHASVHPDVLKKIAECNEGHAPAYGTDEYSDAAQKLFKKHFGEQSESYFVFNGTAANVLSLKACMQSHHAALCSDISHLNLDECGAPEFFTGGKLIPIATTDGKMKLKDIQNAFIRRGDQHYSQIKVICLTQPTELGTLYSAEELKEICAWAKIEKLYVHMDGARFANACTALNLSFKALTVDVGIDVLSLGGTKNALLGAEAVVFLNPKIADEFKYLRKQGAQLPSKTRYLAAQFLAYLENDLWKNISGQSLKMAQLLEAQLREHCPHVPISYPVQSNAVFVKLNKSWIKPLREQSFFYVWDEHSFECRLMTSWDTQATDIEQFVQKLKSLQ
jgi:threonine aldolase